MAPSRLLVLVIAGGCFSTPQLEGGSGDASISCDFTQAPDLVAYLTLDQVVSGQVKDASSNHLDGMVVGDLAVDAGRIGSALRWTARDTYVDLGSGPEVDQLSAMTACVWVSPGGRGDSMNVLDKSFDNQTGGWNMYLAYKNGTTDYGLGFMNRGNAFAETTPMIPKDVAWSHVCVTWDGSANPNVAGSLVGMRFWVNGVEAPQVLTSETRRIPPTSDAANPLRIGSGAVGGPDYTFRGLIDEVLIFERVLDAADIAAIHACAP